MRLFMVLILIILLCYDVGASELKVDSIIHKGRNLLVNLTIVKTGRKSIVKSTLMCGNVEQTKIIHAKKGRQDIKLNYTYYPIKSCLLIVEGLNKTYYQELKSEKKLRIESIILAGSKVYVKVCGKADQFTLKNNFDEATFTLNNSREVEQEIPCGDYTLREELYYKKEFLSGKSIKVKVECKRRINNEDIIVLFLVVSVILNVVLIIKR